LPRIELELERCGLKSRPIFEIHDSIAIDTVPSEAQEVVDLVTKIMCSKRFEWQGDVPLKVAWEAGIEDWYSKASLSFVLCPACGTHGPHSVAKQKRQGAENQEVEYEIHHCGTCQEKQEVLVSI
jgi:hypothetical protein